MFLLHEVFGYEHKEIAEVTGTSAANSRQILARALRGQPGQAAAPRPGVGTGRGAVAGTTDRSVVRISMSRTDRGAPDRYRRLPSPGGGQKAPPEAVTFSGQALTGIPVGAEVGSSSARNASRGC